ncbi:MAG: molybdenum cofactor biosynthesis protein MoaE [Methylophilaceae bacterium]|nr:molybdenum cofactor biosynthesis protein MoaE [Methylophilaceae bacterium]MDG1445756.1 molybdenum cofactor biosynthesis protein MoaE [Methylophilaceae bacterium]MDG1820711.1 molybdenum cofactor biosynthesis protein MoaE [Methylophilaceae bacterium]MDG2293518.1 molybdenum cofactor biosynthesis protein MoaE [Methylophilaceae bacterium]
MSVRVQTADFDVAAALAEMRLASADIGAVVSFIGQVRDINDGDTVNTLTLEHYPQMTERMLASIEKEAQSRWNIVNSLIIHRVGTLKPLDQIVLVAVASAHRGDAFKACEFMMDYLKNQAPFWKKESTPDGDRWIEAKISDTEAQERWQQS